MQEQGSFALALVIVISIAFGSIGTHFIEKRKRKMGQDLPETPVSSPPEFSREAEPIPGPQPEPTSVNDAVNAVIAAAVSVYLGNRNKA